MTKKKAAVTEKPTSASKMIDSFNDSLCNQMLGGFLGISVGIVGIDSTKRVFNKIVKASKKPDFWNAFGGVVGVCQNKLVNTKEFKRAKKCFD